MHTNAEVNRNQNCAEHMLMKAASLVLNVELKFPYSITIADEQIDLGSSFMLSPDTEKRMWYSGKNKEQLEADLTSLNKNIAYFLRTGTNDGAGHWQVLYFDQTAQGWINFSSETNQHQITKNNVLTTAGEGLLSQYATWGKKQGEYSFLIVNASEQNIIRAANYIYDFRVHDLDTAEECLWEPIGDPVFYNELKIAAPAQPAPAQPAPAQAPIDITDEPSIELRKHNTMRNLNTYFIQFMNELRLKTDELIHKGSGLLNWRRAQYAQANLTAQVLMLDLTRAGQQFFNSPGTTNDFMHFRKDCQKAIKKAEPEFSKHRGWYALSDIVRMFIGIIMSPVLFPWIVDSPNSYAQVFFKTRPATDASEKLKDFAKGVNDTMNNFAKHLPA